MSQATNNLVDFAVGKAAITAGRDALAVVQQRTHWDELVDARDAVSRQANRTTSPSDTRPSTMIGAATDEWKLFAVRLVGEIAAGGRQPGKV